jgi:hypothetical protein
VLSETILSPHRTESCDVLAPVFVNDSKAHKPLFPKVSVSFDADASLSSLPSAAMARPVHVHVDETGSGSVYNSAGSYGGSYVSKAHGTSGGHNGEERVKARQSALLTYEAFLPRLDKAGHSSMRGSNAALGPSKRGSPLIPTFHDSYGASSHTVAIGTETETLSLFGGPSLNSIESNELGQHAGSTNGPSFMHQSGPLSAAAAGVIAKHKRVSQMRAEKALARQQVQAAALTSKTPMMQAPGMSESLSSSSLTSNNSPALSSLLMGSTSLHPAVPPSHHPPYGSVSSGHVNPVDLGRVGGLNESSLERGSPRPQSTPLLLSSRQVSAGGERTRGGASFSQHHQPPPPMDSIDGGGSVGDVFDS